MTVGRSIPVGTNVARHEGIQFSNNATLSTSLTAIFLAGLLFLPGALGYFFEGTSFATGTAIICTLALLLASIGTISLQSREIIIASVVAAAVVLIVIVHLLVADAITNESNFDVVRALLSLLLLAIVALAVPVVSNLIMANNRLFTILWIMLAIFLICSIFSLLKIEPVTSNIGEKPTFPFTEPSFLGFTFTSTLIFAMVRSSRLIRIVLLVILSVSAASLDLTYYTDRLDLNSTNSTNLSSLVYVQGWQMLIEALHRTYGWGIGFQQLGIVYTNVLASVRINALLGRDANLQDGGFILSKLGSEFGILGFCLVAFYLRVMIQSFMRLRLTAFGKTQTLDGELFARACVLGYFIETFIRGTNYFTGTLVLMLAGLFYLYRIRNSPLT
jgi:hypothetical protein